MTMNRAIHAAVRRDLDRLEAALRSVPEGDSERVTGLRRAWDHLRGQLTEHHEKEDSLIWPALGGLGVDEILLKEMESEHQRMAAALDQTDEAMQRLSRSGSRAEALDAATSVAQTREVVESHLRHEEEELEPALAPHLESPEWHAVEKELRKGSPVHLGQFFAWLLDGSPSEADRFVRSMMPTPVLFVLNRALGSGYHRSIAPVWRG
jgi:hemerythrin-like domain-containing protein